jgi:hypothetical protein
MNKPQNSHNTAPKYRVFDVTIPLSRSEISRYRLIESILEGLIHRDNKRKPDLIDNTSYKQLLQVSSGTIYDHNRDIISFHNRKISTLKKLLNILENQNVLIACHYKHEMKNIQSVISNTKDLVSEEDYLDWEKGRIKTGLIIPTALRKNCSLEAGSRILIWFSQSPSPALYARTCELFLSKRRTAIIINLISEKTIEQMTAQQNYWALAKRTGSSL